MQTNTSKKDFNGIAIGNWNWRMEMEIVQLFVLLSILY
jgi:hypothetical protein